jgi:cbb3-type cytochrome oxidase subunit 3
VNPVFDVARAAVTDGLLMGVMTIFFFVFFVGYTIWLWLPSNRSYMDQMAKAALDDSSPGAGPVALTSGVKP